MPRLYSEIITVLVTDDEKAAIIKAAREHDMTVCAYMRSLAGCEKQKEGKKK